MQNLLVFQFNLWSVVFLFLQKSIASTVDKTLNLE